jgi:hypothetical protein
MKFKEGQIFFWKGEYGLFSKSINYYNKKKFGRSDCTHCGIIAEVNRDTVLIYEANKNGFEQNYYEIKWLNNQIELGIVHIGECNEKVTNVLKNCEKYKDIKYGWIDIVMIGLSFILGKKLMVITGKNSIICSEAVCRVLYDCTKTIDFQAEYGLLFDYITPEHIFLSKQVTIL